VQSTGASAQWSIRVNDTFRLLSVGSDFQKIHGVDSAAIFDETGAQLRTDVGGSSQRFIRVFGEVDIFPILEFEILASVRYQNFFNFDGIDTIVGRAGAQQFREQCRSPIVTALSCYAKLRAARGGI
jgi:hypothetical protein